MKDILVRNPTHEKTDEKFLQNKIKYVLFRQVLWSDDISI